MHTRSFSLTVAAALLSALSAFAETANVALDGTAYSNRPLWALDGWNISQLIDGDRQGVFHGDTAIEPGFAYSVDLGKDYEITELRIYPRQDGCCPERLTKSGAPICTPIGVIRAPSRAPGIS